MRFREFKRTIKEFAPPTGDDKITQLLSILDSPKSSNNLKQRVTKLFAALIDKKNQPSPLEKQGSPMGQSPVTVESKETQVRQEIESQPNEFQKLIDSNPAFKAAYEAALAQARNEGVNLGMALSKDPDAVIGNINTQIETLLKSLGQIPNDVKSVVADACFSVYRKTQKIEPILNFLKACAQPDRVIDMPGIIAKGGSGTLLDTGNEFFQICQYLAKLNPGSGNSASGQGEWMLIMAGKNTQKIHPGDIAVDNSKVEVKASDTKEGKSGLTDFVLNSKKLPVSQAKKYLVNAINTTLDRIEVSSTGASTGGISALNDKTLKRLNPLFMEMNQKSPGSVQSTFKKMWQTIMPEPELAPYIDKIVAAIDTSGEVRLENLYGPTAVLAAAYYKLANQHDVLLLLNIPTLSYTVITDAEQMGNLLNQEAAELTMSSVFDFRDNPGAVTFKRVVAQTISKPAKN